MAKRDFVAADERSTVAGYFLPEGEGLPDENNPLALTGVDLPDDATADGVRGAVQEFATVTDLSVILTVRPENGRLLAGVVHADLLTDQMRPGRTYLVPTNLGTGAVYCTPGGGYAGATVVFPKGEPVKGIEAELVKRDQIKMVNKGKVEGPPGASMRALAVLMASRGILVTYRIMQTIRPPDKLLLELRIVEEAGDIKVKFGILMNGDKPGRPLNEHEQTIIAAHRAEVASGMFVLDTTSRGFLFVDLIASDVLGLLRDEPVAQMPVPIDKPGHVMTAKADGVIGHFDKLSPATAALFKHVFCGKK